VRPAVRAPCTAAATAATANSRAAPLLPSPPRYKQNKKDKREGKPHSYPTRASKKDAFERLVGKMLPAHAVQKPGAAAAAAGWELRKGALPRVTVCVEMHRAHYTTIVRGLEKYDIDPEAFARAAQRKHACSVHCQALEGRHNVGKVEVMAQGEIANEVEHELVATYNLPAKAVENAAKTKKSKRRK